MSGHCTDAAAERCQVQPKGFSGGLAAECPRGHEHKTGSAKGQRSLFFYADLKSLLYIIKKKDQMLFHVVFFIYFSSLNFSPSYEMKQQEKKISKRSYNNAYK